MMPRYSLVDLFGWTAFFAVGCALVSWLHVPIGLAIILFLWLAGTAALQKRWSWERALLFSQLIGVLLTFATFMWPAITADAQDHFYLQQWLVALVLSAGVGVLIGITIGLVVWSLVVFADGLMQWLAESGRAAGQIGGEANPLD